MQMISRGVDEPWRDKKEECFVGVIGGHRAIKFSHPFLVANCARANDQRLSIPHHRRGGGFAETKPRQRNRLGFLLAIVPSDFSNKIARIIVAKELTQTRFNP